MQRFAMASLKASEPAILKAISEESTSWYWPSIRRTRKSTTRVSGEEAPLAGLPDALLDRRAVVLRNRAAEDLVDELEVLAALQRLDLILQSANCPRPPVCFLWRPWPSAVSLDRLAVGHLRRVQDDLDLEPLLQARDRDLDVELPGAARAGTRRSLRRAPALSVGSSSIRRSSASPIFSSSPFDFGSIAARRRPATKTRWSNWSAWSPPWKPGNCHWINCWAAIKEAPNYWAIAAHACRPWKAKSSCWRTES